MKRSFSVTEKDVKLLKIDPLITDLGRAGLACLYQWREIHTPSQINFSVILLCRIVSAETASYAHVIYFRASPHCWLAQE